MSAVLVLQQCLAIWWTLQHDKAYQDWYASMEAELTADEKPSAAQLEYMHEKLPPSAWRCALAAGAAALDATMLASVWLLHAPGCAWTAGR